MTTRNTIRFRNLAAAAALVVLTTAGCQGSGKGHLEGEVEPTPAHDFFDTTAARQSVTDTFAIQRARGAAADATLTAAHFDGPALNGLGHQKLDDLVAGTPAARSLVVYLSVPEADAAAGRAAITEYFADRGLADEQVRIEAGENPATRHLATLHGNQVFEADDTGAVRSRTANRVDAEGGLAESVMGLQTGGDDTGAE